jgi:hypothetical protein
VRHETADSERDTVMEFAGARGDAENFKIEDSGPSLSEGEESVTSTGYTIALSLTPAFILF